MTLDEFDTLTTRLAGEVRFLYFHLMGEPFLHPLLPEFILMARRKGVHSHYHHQRHAAGATWRPARRTATQAADFAAFA